MNIFKNSESKVKLLIFVHMFLLLLVACQGAEESGNVIDETVDPQSGMIIIQVQTNPTGHTGNFTFEGSASGIVSDGEPLVVSNLEPGSFTITQVDPTPAFYLSSISCDDGDSITPSSGDVETLTATVNLDLGETVTCTFVNDNQGAVYIQAVAEPDDMPVEVGFVGDLQGRTSNIMTTLTFYNMQPGVYSTIQEESPFNYFLSSISCDDGDSPTPSISDLETQSLLIHLDPGERLTCTFVQTPMATAILRAQTVPEDVSGTVEFGGTGRINGTISSNGTLVVPELKPGMYSAYQVNPEYEYVVTDIICDDGDSATPSTSDPATQSVVFNLDPGETVICTFVNTSLGSVVIQSLTEPEGVQGTVEYIGENRVHGTISSNGTLVVPESEPGMYPVFQADPAPDFEVTEIACDDGNSTTPSLGFPESRAAVFHLDPGEMVICTFVNSTERTQSNSNQDDDRDDLELGTIFIQVETELSDLDFDFNFKGSISGTISDNGTLAVFDLPPGVYTTTQEDTEYDFALTSITCDDGDSVTPSISDPATRSVLFHLDPGETVTCTFVQTPMATAILRAQTVPEDVSGTVEFGGTGRIGGTISSNGTLVVPELKPGMYSAYQANPEYEYVVTDITCDDGDSATPSTSDPATRSVVFNLDPGETVICTFVNTSLSGLVILSVTDPETMTGLVEYIGGERIGGTIYRNGSSLVTHYLKPGMYPVKQTDPGPGFEVSEINCDDGNSPTPSLGFPESRKALFHLDPGEVVTCTFVNYTDRIIPGLESDDDDEILGGSGFSSEEGDDSDQDEGINPFTDPETLPEEFPIPDELPPEVGTFPLPLEGNWSVTNFSGSLDCGTSSMAIPAGPTETGTLTVSEDGLEILASGLGESGLVTITMLADPDIIGRFTGTWDGVQDGVPVTIDYFWQMVTEEYIIGYLTSSYSSQGTTCSIYRPFELVHLD
jgi:hypothetical protein